MRKFFGTDGIRGEANAGAMTAELALALGRALATQLLATNERPRVVIGRDTRLSGAMLESALVAGLTSAGADALLVGELPTPGIAYLTTALRADAGVVISASHNPYQDNGLKIFGRDGYKLPDAAELIVEELLHEQLERHHPGFLARRQNIGRAIPESDATDRYGAHLRELLHAGFSLRGLRVVVDCANGAAHRVAPEVLRALGAEVFAIGIAPDGTNINDGCGSTSPAVVGARVRELRADIGLALDGDADRAILVDEDGNEVDGDAVLAICALHLKSTGQLRHNTVVATVMSNIGLERMLEAAGITLIRTAVGDRYVVQCMREHGFNFGGEQSGHLVFLDHTTTGDGLLAGLQVLRVMYESGKSLRELASVLKRYPQVLHSVRVLARPPLDSLPGVTRAIADGEASLGADGRILVRYSGTEAKVRVMVEGRELDEIEQIAATILSAFSAEVGFAEEK
jgi:phosphoglucosamine mutase